MINDGKTVIKQLTLCLSLAFLFSAPPNLKAQESITKHLSFDQLIKVEGGLNYYNYPSNLVYTSYKNEILILEEEPAEIDKEEVFKAVLVKLPSGKQQSFEIRIPKKKIHRQGALHNCALSDKYLLLNFVDKQFLFKRNKNDFVLFSDYTYENITGNIFIGSNTFKLASVGVFGKRGSKKRNFVSEYRIANGREKKIEYLDIEGRAFHHTKPSQIVAQTEEEIIWVEPINHNLMCFNPETGEVDTVKENNPNWKEIDKRDLEELQAEDEIIEILSLTRGLLSEVSRAWGIYFLNEETLISVYHHPEDGGYKFYSNVYKKSQKGWKKEHAELSLDEWLDFPKEEKLTKQNFPFLFGSLGSGRLFSEDYICIITEGSNVGWQENSYQNYFLSKEVDDKSLELHVFKHNF